MFEWHQPSSRHYNDKLFKQAFEDAKTLVYGKDKTKRRSNLDHEQAKDDPETRLVEFNKPDNSKDYEKLVTILVPAYSISKAGIKVAEPLLLSLFVFFVGKN